MDQLRRITTFPSRLAVDALARRADSEALMNAIARYGLIAGVARESWRRLKREAGSGSGRVPDG